MRTVQTIISGIEVVMELLGADADSGPAVTTRLSMPVGDGRAAGSLTDLLMTGCLTADRRGHPAPVRVDSDTIDQIDTWCMQYAP